MYKSTIIKFFSAAHICKNTIDFKEKRLHGHNFKVLITMEGEQFINDELFNFYKLKQMCKFIDENYDHAVLLNIKDNDTITFCKHNNFPIVAFSKDPSSGFIAKRIFEILKLRQVPILSVTVTDNTLLRLED
mgnify:CR=1 FL=1